MRSEVVSFLTGEREAQFVASSSDSEVANELLEEFDIGVAGAEAVKKVRVWSSFFEGSEGESDKSDLENTASVSESSIEMNTTIMPWYQAMRKIQSIFHTKVSSLKAWST